MFGKLPAPKLGKSQEVSRRVPLAGVGTLSLTAHRVGWGRAEREGLPAPGLLSGLLELVAVGVQGLRPP